MYSTRTPETRDAGKRDLHQVVIGLAVGRADRALAKPAASGNLLTSPTVKTMVRAPSPTNVLMPLIALAALVAAAAERRRACRQLIVLAGIIAADVDLDEIGRCDFYRPHQTRNGRPCTS